MLLLLPFLLAFSFAETTTSQSGDFDEQTKPTILKDCDNNVVPDEQAEGGKVCWEPVKKTTDNMKWNAVGQLISDSGDPNCTVTLFKSPTCTKPDAKAQVLTNGHCTKKSNGKMQVQFDMFSDHKGSRVKYDGEKVYESFEGIDLSIVQLSVNYNQIKSPPITPIELARDKFPHKADVDTVGIPLKEISKANQTLKKSVCHTEKVADNITGKVLWKDMIVLDKCSSIQGASGSGLFNSQGQLVGLLNSGATTAPPPSGMHECADTCVYDGKGSPVKENKNFAFDITQLHKCFDGCTLDIHRKGCPLPNRGTTKNPKDKDSSITKLGSQAETNWVNSLKKKMPFSNKHFKSLMVKGCAQGQANCRCDDASGYTATEPLSSLPVMGPTVAITPADYFPGSNTEALAGQPPRLHVLCLRGVNANGSLDDIKNVTQYPLYLYK